MFARWRSDSAAGLIAACPSSAFAGHAPEPTTRAVAIRLAASGQFLLPTEDGIAVARELGRRYALPSWQFTLSATTAVVEAMRLARIATGRDVVVQCGIADGRSLAVVLTPAETLEQQGRKPAAWGAGPAVFRQVSLFLRTSAEQSAHY